LPLSSFEYWFESSAFFCLFGRLHVLDNLDPYRVPLNLALRRDIGQDLADIDVRGPWSDAFGRPNRYEKRILTAADHWG
jgi:hypothetical protein